jgi:hypothetical protein
VFLTAHDGGNAVLDRAGVVPGKTAQFVRVRLLPARKLLVDGFRTPPGIQGVHDSLESDGRFRIARRAMPKTKAATQARPASRVMSQPAAGAATKGGDCGRAGVGTACCGGAGSNGGRNNFPVSVGTGGIPEASLIHIARSEATLRGSLASVTTLLASVGRCSRPERIHKEHPCFATTLLASVERCSRRATQ